ncbi:hypothetical protein [Caviibacter abscessus]|uniref:hypothetical protein n=1 Tax=Caviibacter abscessus TaxID=1766719 RepID=UPI00082D6354|nr:hypothetical protein [Caviibacter abscessus]
MKIIISQNKGYLLLESIITTIFIITFISMFKLLLINANNTKKYINNDEKIIEYIKILDNLVYKVKSSENIIVNNNSIYLDSLRIHFINNSIYVSSGKMKKKELLFKSKNLKFVKKDNMICIYSDFEKVSIKRKILIE